jgi:hypothetical protein
MAFVVKNEKKNEKGILFKANSSSLSALADSQKKIEVGKETPWKNKIKIEEITKSKIVNNTLAFTRGFALGFIMPYFLFKTNDGGNFELVQLPTAMLLGSLNLIRNTCISKEQNKEDNRIFLKTAVASGIISSGVFSMPLVITTISIVSGLIAVANKRIKNKKNRTE